MGVWIQWVVWVVVLRLVGLRVLIIGGGGGRGESSLLVMGVIVYDNDIGDGVFNEAAAATANARDWRWALLLLLVLLFIRFVLLWGFILGDSFGEMEEGGILVDPLIEARRSAFVAGDSVYVRSVSSRVTGAKSKGLVLQNGQDVW